MSLAVASLALSGCLGSEEAGKPPSEESAKPADEPTVAQAHRVQMQLEPGWQAAEQSLTPKLLDPKELLTVGTLSMKPGGCATLPIRTLEAMGAGDALITIQERDGGRPGDYPPRPKRFRVDPAVYDFECAPPDLKMQPFLFSEAGRHFYAVAAVERKAPLDEVEAILNSFEASPEPN
ncbi:MAG TPA: hypothetical protein VD766_14185 [Solirubrobacterales bacterium]|nr:hypothetical protein [Solirubrobacterales bacterium]